MNYELIEELISFGDHCHKLARILETNLNTHKQIETESINTTNILLNVTDYKSWPSINNSTPKFNFNISECSILQLHNYNDIIDFGTKQTIVSPYLGYDDKYKIYRSITDLGEQYDIVVFNQALEFIDDPFIFVRQCLNLLRPNGKLWIRFRPWSSQNGGFQLKHFNKAYSHIVSNIPSSNNVKYRVVKPLFTYENFIRKLNLQVLNRQIDHKHIDNFFTSNPGILTSIISNLWGQIDVEEAIKIMSIDTVTYLLAK